MPPPSRLLVLSGLLPALVLAACGDDTSRSGGGGSGGCSGGGSPSGGVGLTVHAVERSAAAIGGSTPGAGEVFVIVELSLRNERDGSVPLIASAFAVGDGAGVETSGDPRTELLDGGCASDASVSKGGEARCKVLFEPPAGSALDSLVYNHPNGRSEVPLDDAGGGGGSPGNDCAARAVGDHVLAVSVQLAPSKPLFFSASVITDGDGLSLQLYPLRTPYRTPEGGEVMTPVGGPIPILVDTVGSDGAFTAATGQIAIPAEANAISASEITASLTLTGTACPGEPDGTFCGTVSGEVTAPGTLVLDGANFFAFNPTDATQLEYDCAGSVAAPF